jgi:SAM-dependent methyltransferase
MPLLSDDVLERSAIVANCRMNRERQLTGSGGYAREVGLSPLDFLMDRLAQRERVAWLDLCCGRGRALIEAATLLHGEGVAARVEIVGVDLVGMFDPPGAPLTCLRLVEASLGRWFPAQSFDLITCVHGWHYVGDKLGLIARAAGWLVEDGLLVGNLDLANLKWADGRAAGQPVVRLLRAAGLEYDRRRRLLRCRGRKQIALPCRYLGADDQAGPNYTGQPAVNSI